MSGPNPGPASPCAPETLPGSWCLDLTARPVPGALSPGNVRGPMRIDAVGAELRVSGDMYVAVPDPTGLGGTVLGASAGFVIDDNWYPSFPKAQYRWYFRSTAVSYDGSVLSLAFTRHLWDASSETFASRDIGSITLTCSPAVVQPPGAPKPTLEMDGVATIGGREYGARGVKTSPFYRGCLIEVDAMVDRTWPDAAATCDAQQTLSFNGIYRQAGFDFTAKVNRVDVPASAPLSVADMDTLLAANSAPPTSEAWRLWILVASRMADGTLGIMFDRVRPPFREGVAGLYDAPLPDSDLIEASARGRVLGEAKLAFLRTLVHEAGHAFNLVHPKEDVHAPPVGVTLMNQTGDVLDFSTSSNPYPCSALLEFDDHNRTSLIHSPDPQVRPGWKQFGWGHSSFFAGLAEPVDAVGLHAGVLEHEGLVLTLELPAYAHRGEFVIASVTVENTGDQARAVIRTLDLARGDLWLRVVAPSGAVSTVRDVVRACGPRRLAPLGEGAERWGQIELLFTSAGFTFDQPGTYTVQAECVPGRVTGPALRSPPTQIVIRPAVSDQERAIERTTLHHDAGVALAFGDVGSRPDLLERLTQLMDAHPETGTGAAGALVVANSLYRASSRSTNPNATGPLADRAWQIACSGRDPTTVARLCAAVASPIGPSAPIVTKLAEELVGGSDTPDEDARRDTARKILTDQFPPDGGEG